MEDSIKEFVKGPSKTANTKSENFHAVGSPPKRRTMEDVYDDYKKVDPESVVL